jgi:hypothetical protein
MPDREKLMETVKDVAIPRRAGTPGEAQVAAYVASRFEGTPQKAGGGEAPAPAPVGDGAPEGPGPAVGGPAREVTRQDFSFPPDTGRLTLGIYVLILTALLFFNLVILSFFERSYLRAAMPLTSMALLIFLIFGLNWDPLLEGIGRRKTPRDVQASNVLCRIDCGAPATLIFTAHHDSKSDSLGPAARSFLSAAAFGGSLLAGIYCLGISLAVMQGASPDQEMPFFVMTANLIAQLGIIVVMLIVCILFVVPPGNGSPGALDNASGTAVLLALADHFRESPPAGINVWLLSTSAEEEGLVGIVRFLDLWKEKLDRKNTFFVSLDSVGGEGRLEIVDRYGFPPKRTAFELSRRLQEAALAEGVRHAPRWVPSLVGFDSIPPAFRGFQSANLTYAAMDRRLGAVHTEKDTPENVSAEAMEETFRVCRRLVEEMGSAGAPAGEKPEEPQALSPAVTPVHGDDGPGNV